MGELTILIDYGANEKLQSYLLSLTGVLEVSIDDMKETEIYIKYNSLTMPKIIKMEIELFLELLKVPSTIGLDKHSQDKLSIYTICRKNVCCEYCLKGAIDDLFNVQGTEKVDCNFFCDVLGNTKINAYYSDSIIINDEIKRIDLNLAI